MRLYDGWVARMTSFHTYLSVPANHRLRAKLVKPVPTSRMLVPSSQDSFQRVRDLRSGRKMLIKVFFPEAIRLWPLC